jgi:hypothetical protein
MVTPFFGAAIGLILIFRLLCFTLWSWKTAHLQTAGFQKIFANNAVTGLNSITSDK